MTLSDTQQEKDDFFKEASIMQNIQHENLLPLLCIVIKDNIPHVVTPYMENGDLRKYLKRKDKVLYMIASFPSFLIFFIKQSSEYTFKSMFAIRADEMLFRRRKSILKETYK